MVTVATATKQPVDYEIVLVLSKEEATALRRVGQHIGGHPSRSSRDHFDSINKALDVVGVHADYNDNSVYGSVYFRDR